MGRLVGVIDIGSNAVRLSVQEIEKDGYIRDKRYRRIGLRLGADAFSENKFSDETIESFTSTMVDVKRQLDDLNVTEIECVATDAMRTARNAKLVLKQIEKLTGINVETISGAKESNITQLALEKNVGWLPDPVFSVDLGGGSFEIGRLGTKKRVSLPYGAVRLLERFPELSDKLPLTQLKNIHEKLRLELVRERSRFILSDKDTFSQSTVLAAGGTFRILSLQTEPVPLSPVPAIDVNGIWPLLRRLAKLTVTERMRSFRLRRDRADLIVAGIIVVQAFVDAFNIDKLFVPGTGLRAGLVLRHEQKYAKKQWGDTSDPIAELLKRFGASTQLIKQFLDHCEIFKELWHKTYVLHKRSEEGFITACVGKAFERLGQQVDEHDPAKHGQYLVNHSSNMNENLQERGKRWFYKRGNRRYGLVANALWEISTWLKKSALTVEGVMLEKEGVRLVISQTSKPQSAAKTGSNIPSIPEDLRDAFYAGFSKKLLKRVLCA